MPAGLPVSSAGKSCAGSECNADGYARAIGEIEMQIPMSSHKYRLPVQMPTGSGTHGGAGDDREASLLRAPAPRMPLSVGAPNTLLQASLAANDLNKAATVQPEQERSSEQWADYSNPQNRLFQNLVSLPGVRDYVVAHEDGTYSFDWTPADGVLSNQAGLARLLVLEQNGLSPREPGAVSPYSIAELQMFRDLTGFNLVQMGGGVTVVDDFGGPPSALAMAAWAAFDLAKGVQEQVAPGADITIDLIAQAAEGIRDNQPGADKGLFDTLIEMLQGMRPEI